MAASFTPNWWPAKPIKKRKSSGDNQPITTRSFDPTTRRLSESEDWQLLIAYTHLIEKRVPSWIPVKTVKELCSLYGVAENYPLRMFRRLREYNNYHREKLSKLWQIKTAVAKLIYKNQGRNNFDIPHNLL